MLLDKDSFLKLMNWEEIRKIKIHPGTVRNGFYQKALSTLLSKNFLFNNNLSFEVQFAVKPICPMW
jgi:hypothetical protein